METRRIRVMIVDDHSIVRQGIKSLLSSHVDIQVVGEADTAEHALALVRGESPDVALVDIRMPGVSGLDLVRPMLHTNPACKIVILSSFDDDEHVTRALQLGVTGFVSKGSSDALLVQAIYAAYRGERILSPGVMDRVIDQYAALSKTQAQRMLGLDADDIRMLQWIVDGASNQIIAERFHVSEATAKRKLAELFRKLGTSTRAQAAAEAVRRHLL
jgi:DNA-binding NarL/FixJ family response regulator